MRKCFHRWQRKAVKGNRDETQKRVEPGKLNVRFAPRYNVLFRVVCLK